MAKIALLFVVSTLLAISCSDGTTGPSPVQGIKDILNAQREKYRLPAIAGAYINNREIETAVIGARKLGNSDSATSDDRWHIGSNAKAMSATMIATLVEEGKLAWDTTIADIFPEFSTTMKPEYRNVTLAMLLTHRGAILPIDDMEAMLALPDWQGTVLQQRRAFAEWLLTQLPATAPGTYKYSNGGYALAAAMAEKVTELPWETLITQRLFIPLGMTPVFGWPAEGGARQPWGHVETNAGYEPFDPDGEIAFPVILIPSGHCSMSLGDYIRFARAHLDGLRGTSSLLKKETFEFLHTPVGDYACGWSIADLDGVKTSWHEGSDGTFDAMIVMQPARNRAAIVITNCASDQALVAINDACLRLIGK